MFFTRLGLFVASLALLMAAGRAGIAVYIATFMTNAAEAKVWTARYLGMPTAEAIDQAAVVAAFAIGLGILVEISRSLRR